MEVSVGIDLDYMNNKGSLNFCSTYMYFIALFFTSEIFVQGELHNLCLYITAAADLARNILITNIHWCQVSSSDSVVV